MSSVVYFDDLSVGQKWTSSRRTVTESDVIIFAGMTGDFDRAHVDHDYASKSRFKQPLMHGLMGLAWAAGLSTTAPAVRTMALVSVDQWKFLRPVHIGDTVYAVTEVIELASGGRSAGKVTWKKSLFNTQGEEVQSGLFISLVELAPRAPRAKVAAPHLSLEPSSSTVTDSPALSGSANGTSVANLTNGASVAFATESVQVVNSTIEVAAPQLVEPPRFMEVLSQVAVAGSRSVNVPVTPALATNTWTAEAGGESRAAAEISAAEISAAEGPAPGSFATATTTTESPASSGTQEVLPQPEEMVKESG
ncbi:MAG: hypothetical protein JNK57_06275 [Planctomycetaceae bacterium]|nr:hypothetical protein [Planctomycetaceae bacterium]